MGRLGTQRRRALRTALVTLAAAGLFSVDASRPAGAVWPPERTFTAEDMKNPANWPNDPHYAYVTAQSTQARKSGAWEFFSFIPDRSPGAQPVRPGEMASGMSIDLAWRYGIGDSRVTIAVLDSGVRWHDSETGGPHQTWEAGDIRDKAWLNAGELASHKPLQANGSACGGTGALAGFDCNADGVLSLNDYAEDPTLLPDAVDGRPRGDMNRNGVLDPGDLILNFSDGIDDDNNGYTDDICGWDFFKNDNDPFDDTEYLHGSQEASWSTAKTNDGVGYPGPCPLCRFIPLRVGDSFVAEPQDFSQAVVYAVDNGASIVQEALGTIAMTSFAQAALSYAWGRGVLVAASMGDENARHHNFPATANHTMPVHAITMVSQTEDATSATSFFAYNNCTNYGAQNFLSVSGLACSSEAAGRVAGIAGLLYSSALQTSLTPALTADEVMQLIMMTADDIDVPESRATEDSAHYWSQPGFDQRFGYGRVNANTAATWLDEGRIPPEVDIVSPEWFQVLYPEQVTGPVPIKGRISARRAPSYSYVVDWAPGVQPLEEAFQVVKTVDNIAASMEVGADGAPLAELDIQDLDTTHEPDSDSPMGENKYTITVRVRATAHYGGTIGDVPGELRRAYAVHRDPSLLPGFPIRLGTSSEASPKLADIDGDGVRDLVLATSDGALHVWSMASGSPSELAGFPFKVKQLDGLDGDANRPSYLGSSAYASGAVDLDLARESITATPAIGDLTGDGKPEIVVTTSHGTLYAIGSDGQVLPGWPYRLPDVPSCPLDRDAPDEICMGSYTELRNGEPVKIFKILARGAFGSPVLEDLTGDGKYEVIQAAFDGHVYVLGSDGKVLPNWPVRVHYPRASAKEFNRVLTTPAVADFNGDGVPDLVVGSNEKLGAGSTGAFYIIDGRGTAANPPYLANWPVTMVSLNLFPLIAEGVASSPVVANFEGVPHAIMHGNGSAPLLVPGDPGGQATSGSIPANAYPVRTTESGEERGLEPSSQFGVESKARTPDTMFPLFAQPAMGDLNQDGVPDIIASGASLSVANNLLSSQRPRDPPQYLLSMWDGKTGQMLPASPVPLEDFTFFNNLAVADLSGDGYPEVVTGTGGYYVHAVDACGREASGFPKFTNQWIIGTVAIGDIDGDDKLEVVAGSRNGWLYAWRTEGRTDGVIAWESFHHDNRNTGNYEVPLGDGKLLGARTPLRLDEEGRCVPDAPPSSRKVEAEGGCGCRLPGTRRSSGLPALALGGVLLLWSTSRRRRRALDSSLAVLHE